MVCTNYNLCDDCQPAGVHDEHKMLKIEHPADALSVENNAVCIVHLIPIFAF